MGINNEVRVSAQSTDGHVADRRAGVPGRRGSGGVEGTAADYLAHGAIAIQTRRTGMRDGEAVVAWFFPDTPYYRKRAGDRIKQLNEAATGVHDGLEERNNTHWKGTTHMNYDARIVPASVYRAGVVESTKRTRKAEVQATCPECMTMHAGVC